MGWYRQYRDLYEDLGSDVTSQVFFVGDAERITLSLNNSDSTFTVQMNNGEGHRSALVANEWSDVTTLKGGGPLLLDVTPGPGWLRVQRSLSTTTVTLNTQTRF
jgi:hypothetical protein